MPNVDFSEALQPTPRPSCASRPGQVFVAPEKQDIGTRRSVTSFRPTILSYGHLRLAKAEPEK